MTQLTSQKRGHGKGVRSGILTRRICPAAISCGNSRASCKNPTILDHQRKTLCFLPAHCNINPSAIPAIHAVSSPYDSFAITPRISLPCQLSSEKPRGFPRFLSHWHLALSIKYCPSGEIVIGARELEAERGIECWVSDNGAGIAEDFIEKVFVKGESDPGDAGGTGLGLAIVKTVTEAHGGKVSVESNEGVGSTFRFSLPTKANAGKGS